MESDPTSRIVTPQSVLDFFEREGQWFVAKHAITQQGNSDIRAQINMLRFLPETLAKHYPKLIEWSTENDDCSYVMPYYRQKSLRQFVFGMGGDSAIAGRYIDRIIDFLCFRQFPMAISQPTERYLEETYFQRVITRLRKASDFGPVLNRLVQSNTININGRRLISAVEAVMEINRDQTLLSKLRPSNLGWIHGQAAFFHLLCSFDSEEPDNFVLLDPRGLNAQGDLAYDLGKILQSANSRIDLVEEQQFTLKYHFDRTAILIDQFELVDRRNSGQIADLASAVKRHIQDIGEALGQELLLRAQFAEAMHILSAVPFNYHGREPEQRALACFVLGTLAINDFLERMPYYG